MSTEEEIKTIRKALSKKRKAVTNNKAAATKFLISIGAMNKDGKLKKRYSAI